MQLKRKKEIQKFFAIFLSMENRLNKKKRIEENL